MEIYNIIKCILRIFSHKIKERVGNTLTIVCKMKVHTYLENDITITKMKSVSKKF